MACGAIAFSLLIVNLDRRFRGTMVTVTAGLFILAVINLHNFFAIYQPLEASSLMPWVLGFGVLLTIGCCSIGFLPVQLRVATAALVPMAIIAYASFRQAQLDLVVAYSWALHEPSVSIMGDARS